MAKPPYFKFFVGDFLVGTILFTDQQVGVYIRLLCHQWDNEFISDIAYSKIIHGLEEGQRGEIHRKFEWIKSKGFQNKRLEETRIELSEYLEKQIKNAKLGAQARWKTNGADGSADGNAGANAESMPSKSKSKSKSKEEKSKDKDKPKKGGVGGRGSLRNWPEGFELTEPMKAYAEKKGVIDPNDEFEAFKNWADQLEKKFKDWEAAWRTRCDNYSVFSGHKKSSMEDRYV